LPTARLEGLCSGIRCAGASYLTVDKTILSARSMSAEDFLNRIRIHDFSFIFEEEDKGHEMHVLLKQCLGDLSLDYKWSWEGQYRTDPGILLHDAACGEEAQFLAVGDRIALEAADLADPLKVATAKRWAAWKPRPFIVYDSNHDLLRAQAAYL